MSPTVLGLHRAGGRAALGTIYVALHGERRRRFRVRIQDIRQLPNGAQAYEPPSGSRFSASSWVAVTPRRFPGSPDRTQPIQYRVRVPPDAEPGDHLTSLTVERLPAGGGATAAPIEAVSVRLTIRVPGRTRPAARIAGLSAPTVAGGGTVAIAATVRNTGNVTLDFDRGDSGRIAVLDGGDRRAALPFGGRLFPGESRAFQLAWDNPPLFGHFEAVASVDAGDRTVRESVGFWVIPWREIAALILVVLAVLVVALGMRRRRWGY